MILDVLLVLVLVSFLVYGYRSGLVRSVSGIVGIVVGGALAYVLAPLAGALVESPEWRVVVTVGASLLLIAAGLTAGVTLGDSMRTRVARSPLRGVDRLVGAAASVVAAALVTSTIAFGIGTLGVPLLSQPIANSQVLRVIGQSTPDGLTRMLAAARSFAVRESLPQIADAFAGAAPTIPDVETGSPELDRAAASIVRITGTAFACGQNQSGSGFVVAPDRIVTNAHVVAGVDEPVVETPRDGSRVGRVVYFDPVDDLAVIAVEGLDTAALELGTPLTAGDTAIVGGYPFGGPFSAHPAEVAVVGPLVVPDIYGESTAARDVYTLASDVQQGESGGPVLATSGDAVGIVFAKGATTEGVGYAATLVELEPVVVAATGLTGSVASGTCVRG
ncbi:MarP family serine protease [Marisediminicola sp. LYQ134]|uniref:MarP family serine protease n=1 Tax=Marisediminicola sp. LYQ134 TaxID=3391061 RepID=UPI003983D86F